MPKSSHGPRSGANAAHTDLLGSGTTTDTHVDTGVRPIGNPMEGTGGMGRMDNHGGPSGEVFGFTIASGVVTAATITTPAGTVIELPRATGVTYSVSGTDVLATRVEANTKDVVLYSDADHDGLYQVVSSSEVFTTAATKNALGFTNRETVKITQSNGVITGVTETMPNGTQKVALSDTVKPTDTTWAMTNGLLVETHTGMDGVVHYEVFRDGNGDGIYTEVAHGMGATIDLVGIAAATGTEPILGSL